MSCSVSPTSPFPVEYKNKFLHSLVDATDASSDVLRRLRVRRSSLKVSHDSILVRSSPENSILFAKHDSVDGELTRLVRIVETPPIWDILGGVFEMIRLILSLRSPFCSASKLTLKLAASSFGGSTGKLVVCCFFTFPDLCFSFGE